MEQRHHGADHVLLVISTAYLAAPYSNWERQAAQWASADKRPNFALPVFIEDCEAWTLLAHVKRCDLYGLSEIEARAALAAYLAPAEIPSAAVPFFGAAGPPGGANGAPGGTRVQPGSYYAVSNISIRVPRHFLGRDEDLAAIDTVLSGKHGHAIITTALHGLRGVGKTTLAAAYAWRRRGDYRATWWIKAETIPAMRADLVGLAVRLGWVAADEKEEPALGSALERLRDQGAGILLIYDNANNAAEIGPYVPLGGAAHIIVTSNAPNWSGVAEAVEIEKWPPEIGADYLVAQAGRPNERDAALVLSEALDGLPLAHEQAAAYCARTGLSLADYRKKFEAEPTKFLDAEKDADGLDEAVAALRAFALIDRESIPDEREPAITTDCIRLHRLVRQVSAGRFDLDTRENARRELIEVVSAAYPSTVHNDPKSWPRARRLDSHAMALVDRDDNLPVGSERSAANLLGKLDAYRDGALAAYSEAREFSERALAIREKALGPTIRIRQRA
jgi:hypothetical protein